MEIKDISIGGYFSLELPYHDEYHKEAIKLNTGRNCLEYILRCRRYKKVYISYYTCEVILEPFLKTETEYSLYHIDLNFEITNDIVLQKDEALLYTNYFGLKQRYIEKLVAKYGKQLIIDNTQAFYDKPIENIDTFYTCRKFYGVPDGAYLYLGVPKSNLSISIEQDISFSRMNHLLKRIDLSVEEGFSDFRRVDDGLDNQPIRWMSKLTKRLMQSIAYKDVAKQRRENFLQLHEALKGTNILTTTPHTALYDNHRETWFTDDTVPMVYPYLTNHINLREHLIQNKIFVPCYWTNVLQWTNENSTEHLLAQKMIPLPIDQRYGKNDMNRIITVIQECQYN